MKLKFLIIGIIGIFVVVSALYFVYFYPRAKLTPIPNDINQVQITMSRSPCFGTCPVYSLKIFGNGTVIYQGERFVKVIGTRVSELSQDQVKGLVDEFYRIDYFSLKDHYEASITDLPSTTTSITIDGKNKSVYNYYGAPDVLNHLENRIDEVTNSSAWIKG